MAMQQAELLALTTSEAAYIVQQTTAQVEKAIEAGPIKATVRKASRTSAPRRTLQFFDVVYLVAMAELKNDFTPKARAKFYAALKKSTTVRAGTRAGGRVPLHFRPNVSFGQLKVDVTKYARLVKGRMRDLERLSNKVEFRSDHEPLIEGTSIEVHRIAALLTGGASVDRVLDDYPSLTREQVVFAEEYARTRPKRGRPYPKLSVKHAMAEAAKIGLGDVLPSDDA